MTIKENFFSREPKKGRLVDSIVEQIENVIIERELSVGDKLPSSRQLQKMLGISQGTLREALQILGQKGLIEAKLGRSGGLYVKAVTSDNVSESLSLMIRQKQISFDHLAVFRSSLEVLAASLAAIEADKKDISRLKKLLGEARKHLEKGIDNWIPFYKTEDRLHHALWVMTNNPLFESVLLTIYQNHPGYKYRRIPNQIETMKDTYKDWFQLIEAIAFGKQDKAGLIMTRHTQRFLATIKKTKE